MNISVPRPVKRLLFGLFIIGTFMVLSILLEPRRRSVGCRTLWSCVNPYRQREYQVTTVPEEEQVAVLETTLADGTVKFNRKLKPEAPNILFLVVTRDGHSWSRDFQSTRRSIYDFLDLLASTQLDPQKIALGLLTETQAEFELLKKATDEIPLGRVTVLWKKRKEGDIDDVHVGEKVDGPTRDRWNAGMAKQRNYLMNRALYNEQHVIWIDAGTVELSPGIVQKMVGHGDARADVGIVTARCQKSKVQNFDTNAWAIDQNSGLLTWSHGFDGNDRKAMIQELEKSQVTVPELIKGSADSDLLPLHSVGGTILYIKADLVRQGLIFPWWKVIGTTWKDEGWIGLDTQGLCYLSSRMQGGGCFVLGGSHRVRHTDFG